MLIRDLAGRSFDIDTENTLAKIRKKGDQRKSLMPGLTLAIQKNEKSLVKRMSFNLWI